jgi:hypothetical protein
LQNYKAGLNLIGTMSENPFAVAANDQSALVQLAQSREAQQIQAALVVAKKFPRDQHAAFQRIIEACKRPGLAEEATYLYARGGTQISGASIRLLEVIAQQWGNFQSGVIELDNVDGESRVMAIAWDLETNAHDFKTFTVRHERYTKTAGIEKLTDPRDQYEHVANFAARRKRACMEAVIPRDIIDSAIEQCDKTLKTGHTEPLVDRVRKMVTAFADFQVSVEMLERRLQHKLSAVSEQEMVILRKIFTSLKDGMGKREDFFDIATPSAPQAAKFDEEKKKKAEAEAAAKKAEADKKAEAAAGLAPASEGAKTEPAKTEPAKDPAATTPQAGDPVMTEAQARMAKARDARAAKKAAMAAPPQEPEPPKAPEAPAAPAGELFGSAPAAPSNVLAAKCYELIGAQKITETEVLDVLKFRKLCEPTTEQIVQLPDDVLEDLAENIEAIAGQIRINRRHAARK